MSVFNWNSTKFLIYFFYIIIKTTQIANEPQNHIKINFLFYCLNKVATINDIFKEKSDDLNAKILKEN